MIPTRPRTRTTVGMEGCSMDNNVANGPNPSVAGCRGFERCMLWTIPNHFQTAAIPSIRTSICDISHNPTKQVLCIYCNMIIIEPPEPNATQCNPVYYECIGTVQLLGHFTSHLHHIFEWKNNVCLLSCMGLDPAMWAPSRRSVFWPNTEWVVGWSGGMETLMGRKKKRYLIAD